MKSTADSGGIYFLANDRVLDWAIALLESIRAHDASLPLVLIPYDDRLDSLVTLAQRYSFQVYSDSSLAKLDELGAGFAPENEQPGWVPMFRKFAAFWGPLQNAIYLDCDIVVLDSLAGLLQAFEGSDLDFCFFDETDEFIYQSENLRRSMKERFGARLFNAGYWAVRRDKLTFEQVVTLADEARALREEFYYGMDQPFLNYCVHRGALRHGGFSDLVPGLAHHHWAARWRRIERRDGSYRVCDSGSPDCGKAIKLLHWAGSGISPVMPYRREFLTYRLRSVPRWGRASYRASAWARYLAGPAWRDLKTWAGRLSARRT